jgi:hypothetical protein
MGVEFELQKAVYTTLNASGDLASAVVGIYDVAPEASNSGRDTAFPYITFGAMVLTPLGTDEVSGFEAAIRLHTHSRSGSSRECKIIQGLIYSALHNVSMSVTGFNCFSVLREESFVERTPEAKFHGVCEYRALLQKT